LLDFDSHPAAICAGVIGKLGDIDGVCTPPVMAQVMMTLSARFMLVVSGQGVSSIPSQ
jgi:hypothetical protein